MMDRLPPQIETTSFFQFITRMSALLSDLDGDGFHHAFNVFFDVDVSHDSATIYAKLYLSRDGGPWSQYHTTNLFSIYGDDYSDAYEVTTELLEGYPPGYYDVLIEVFSLNHPGMVTSQVLDYHYLGRDVMLEDLSRGRELLLRGGFLLIWSGQFFNDLVITDCSGGDRGQERFPVSPRGIIIRRKCAPALRSFVGPGAIKTRQVNPLGPFDFRIAGLLF